MKDEMEERFLLLEMHDRKLNLLFYGVKPSPYEDPYVKAREVISSLLGITMEEAKRIHLVNAHRLPTKLPPEQQGRDANSGSSPPRPQPIIVRFGTMLDRDRIIKAYENPGRQRYDDESPFARMTVRSDLPAKMKRERGKLAAAAYKIRKDKEYQTRIKIVGTKIALQTRKVNKRGGTASNWTDWTEK